MDIQIIANENKIPVEWKPLQGKYNRIEVTSKGSFIVTTREKEWSIQERVARAALGILLGFTLIAFCFDSYWNLFSKNRVKEFWIPLHEPMAQIPQTKPFPQPTPVLPRQQPFNPPPVQINNQPIHPSRPTPKQPSVQIQPQVGEYEKFVKSKIGTPLTRNQAFNAIKIYEKAIDDEYNSLIAVKNKIIELKVHQNFMGTSDEMRNGILKDILTDQEVNAEIAREQELNNEVCQLRQILAVAHNSRMNSENTFTFDSDNILEIVCKLAALKSIYEYLDT